MSKRTDVPTSEGVALTWLLAHVGKRDKDCESKCALTASKSRVQRSRVQASCPTSGGGYCCVRGDPFGEHHRQYAGIVRLRDLPIDAANYAPVADQYRHERPSCNRHLEPPIILGHQGLCTPSLFSALYSR
jgi:hypothetical protein